MADINFKDDEKALREAVELLFYAYRDFTSDPDAILAEYGFGRAHHRAVHFIGRYPGIAVAELLAILRITKQALARVLGQLIRQGFVRQEQGKRDRRQRLLFLADKGLALDARLTAPQHARVGRAFRLAGPEAVAGWRAVLIALLDPDKRDSVLELLARE
ncbi:MAG: MarR family transcriptional regulator [Alphaproteobacteria bacterium]|nr:MarR family transcriptional regulator [Alphaproteobacteria bacterium]